VYHIITVDNFLQKLHAAIVPYGFFLLLNAKYANMLQKLLTKLYARDYNMQQCCKMISITLYLAIFAETVKKNKSYGGKNI